MPFPKPQALNLEEHDHCQGLQEVLLVQQLVCAWAVASQKVIRALLLLQTQVLQQQLLVFSSWAVDLTWLQPQVSSL